MSDRLDYYIYEPNFVGAALVVFGVPGEAPLVWNDAHNGWDISIPANTQILFTSTQASEVSIYVSHRMLDFDGNLQEMPYQTPTEQMLYAAVGPRSSPMAIDLDAKTYVEFWTYSPMTLCDPCPRDAVPASLTSRDAVYDAAKGQLLHRIQQGEIPREVLDIREIQ